MKTNPDVVIIGAGAAGIAAAHALIDLNIDVTVVEAADHIGGRCWTDMTTFGVPYDVGAHWLHLSEDNFYVPYGQQHGFDLYPDSRNIHFYRQAQEVPDGFSMIGGSLELYEQTINTAARTAIDVSIAQATKHLQDPNAKTVEFILGPWIMGKEVAEISVKDHSSGADGTDWFCRNGFGTLVAHYGSSLPISLNTQATAIDWSGKGVKVETNQGVIKARAAVITVSTGVLARNQIRFSPHLSAEKEESFHAIPMGCYEHVVLQFSNGGLFDEQDRYIIRMADDDYDGFGALVNVCGTGLVYCDIGGNIARDLVSQGEAACIDFVLNELVQILGSQIRSNFTKGTATAWLNNSLTQGSYASAKPGHFHSREVLREPVGAKIFFAGEACHPTMWATVAGAHKSGRNVAIQVKNRLT